MKKQLKIRYESNNSGGRWWLSDKNWKDLERKGWKVNWYVDEIPSESCDWCKGTGKFLKDETPFKKGDKCICFKGKEKARFLGALAQSAEKLTNSPVKSIREWEKITKLDSTSEGCNCCGPPHTFWIGNEECFNWKCKHKDSQDKEHFWNFYSGDSILEILYPDKKIPKSMREAVMRLK